MNIHTKEKYIENLKTKLQNKKKNCKAEEKQIQLLIKEEESELLQHKLKQKSILQEIRNFKTNIEIFLNLFEYKYKDLFYEIENYIKKYNQKAIIYLKKKAPLYSPKVENFIQLILFLHEQIIEKSYTNNVVMNETKITNLFEDIFLLKDELWNPDTLKKITNLEIYQKKKNIWIDCQSDCLKFWRDLVKKEIQSTAYMLRLIVNSLLGEKKNSVLHFTTNDSTVELTGIWEDDYKNINIQIIDADEKNKTKRTILGFGPSSSGKTYWAEEIMKLFSEKFNDFPKIFLSIDGGIMRESSIIYQLILKQNAIQGIPGFTNLVTAGVDILSTSIFSSDFIKKSLVKFLNLQTIKGNKISIYVPETLGGCYSDLCIKKYKKYLDLTGDENWIALMIYQHLDENLCDFPSEFKCIGTIFSGRTRQIKQGKKYSSSAFKISIKNGRQQLNKSKFCQLEIHNSGNPSKKSVITEFPTQNKFHFTKGEYKKYIILHGQKETQDFKKENIDFLKTNS